MKRILTLLAFTLLSCVSFAQPLSRPKVVIGIVVDQMRWDYIYKFYN